MSTNVNIPSKESIAFNNYEENQINFEAIAKICVGGEFIVKFPSVPKQKKINSKPKVDIKIPLPKKKVVAHCDKIDYIKLDKCISKLLECSSKMKQYEKESSSFSVRDMICSSNKESHFEHRAWDNVYDFSENIVCCLKELKVI